MEVFNVQRKHCTVSDDNIFAMEVETPAHDVGRISLRKYTEAMIDEKLAELGFIDKADAAGAGRRKKANAALEKEVEESNEPVLI